MDTINTALPFIGLSTRGLAIENGQIHDTTKYTKDFGIIYESAVTNQFFKILYPYAEDAVKHITYHERLESLVSHYKVAATFGRGFYVEFIYKYDSYIDEYIDTDRVKCFADGKARPKEVSVYGALMPCKDEKPSLLFGIV